MAYDTDEETTQDIDITIDNDEDAPEVDEDGEEEYEVEEEENEYDTVGYEVTSDKEDSSDEEKDEETSDQEAESDNEEAEEPKEVAVVKKKKTKKTKSESTIYDLPRSEKTEISLLKHFSSAYVDWSIPEETIEELIHIKVKNGEYLLDRNPDMSMNVVSMLAEDAVEAEEVEELLEFFRSCKDPKSALMNQPCMLDARVNNNFEMYALNIKEEGVKNIGVCPKCHNDKLIAKKVQMRSGDEGMNIHFGCPNCKHKWSA